MKKKQRDKAVEKQKKNDDNVIYVKGSKEAEESNKEIEKTERRKNNIIGLVVFVLVLALLFIASTFLNKEYLQYLL